MTSKDHEIECVVDNDCDVNNKGNFVLLKLFKVNTGLYITAISLNSMRVKIISRNHGE